MLRAQRTLKQEKERQDRRRELVMKALQDRYVDQSNDKLLANIVAAVPRTTPAMIASTVQKVRTKDPVAADKLEDALNQCQMLAENLNGARPDAIWTDTVRMLWSESLESIIAQTSNWKATPLVVVHPFAGTVVVLTSLCGKFQSANEYSRMKQFEEALRDGVENVLEEIHPVRDNQTGISVPKEATRNILLDLSGNNGEANNDDELSENISEEEEEAEFDRFNEEVKTASENWSDDPPPSPTKLTKGSTPTAQLMSTPDMVFERVNSSNSTSFNATLPGIEDIHQSTRLVPPPALAMTPKPVWSAGAARTLFVKNEPTHQNESVSSKASTTSKSSTASTTPSEAAQLAEAFPQGYSVIPHKPKGQKKTDQSRKTQREKKRPIGSPNYPASKSSRLDATEAAITQIQVHQATQAEAMQNLAAQISNLAMNIAVNMSANQKK